MSRSPAKKRLEWSEVGVLAMLGGLVVFGFAANGLSLLQSVVSLCCVAGVLLTAWLWRFSLRRADTPRLRPGGRRCGMREGVAWVAVVGALAWWAFASDRSDRTRQEGSPSAIFPNASDDPLDDDSAARTASAHPFKKLPSRRGDCAN